MLRCHASGDQSYLRLHIGTTILMQLKFYSQYNQSTDSRYLPFEEKRFKEWLIRSIWLRLLVELRSIRRVNVYCYALIR